MSKSFPVLAIALFLLVLFSLPAASYADSSPIPVPDAKGDYRDCGVHRYWIVVEKDWENGLNGRVSPSFPKNYEAEDCTWPSKPDINKWPVVTRFLPETALTAGQVNGVTISLDDNRGNPWLMVTYGTDRVCFVRANSRYIKPMKVKE